MSSSAREINSTFFSKNAHLLAYIIKILYLCSTFYAALFVQFYNCQNVR